MASHSIRIGGQTAWAHKDFAAGGLFHTYDALQCAGPTDAPRKVHVWLPPGYGHAGRRHPVVYCNDGQAMFFPGTYGHSWRAQDVVAHMLRQRDFAAPILVGIDPLDRSHEYLHVREYSPHARAWRGGGLAQYGDYVANHVRPFIDAHYLSFADRTHRSILGSSHGGLAAFWIGVMYGGDIGNVIAMSSSFWAGELGDMRHTRLYAATRGALDDRQRRPRIYLDWGLRRDGGFHNAFAEKWATWRSRDLASVLRADFGYRDGVDLWAREDARGSHDERSWSRRLPGALAFVMG